MNSTHKIIDIINKFIPQWESVKSDSFINAASFLHEEKKDLINAIKFTFDDCMPERVKAIYTKLPFDLCFYEMKSETSGIYGYLLRQLTPGVIRGTLYMDTPIKTIEPQYIEFFIENNNGEPVISGNPINNSLSQYSYNEAKPIIIECCSNVVLINSVMACSNITLIDNAPSRLKQSRVKKGKTPLFTYKTLHIKTSYTKGKNKGEGKHASPRVHLRRGHIRTLNSGLTTWVQSCVVGDKSKGMVHKDYAVCSDV